MKYQSVIFLPTSLAKTNYSIRICMVFMLREYTNGGGGDRVPNPRWTTIPNFIWVTPYVLAIAYGEFIFVDLELCPFWHLLWIINCMLYNHISGIMVSLLALSVVDRGFEPWLVKPQTIKLVFVASPLSTQQFRSNS